MKRALCLMLVLAAAPGCMVMDEIGHELDYYYESWAAPAEVVHQPAPAMCENVTQAAANLPAQTAEPPR